MFAFDPLADVANLLGCWEHPKGGKRIEVRHPASLRKFAHQAAHARLKARPAREDYAYADRSLGVQALEIFQIAVEKRIFVVPLDFTADRANRGNPSHVIDLVGGGLSLHAVDVFRHNELMFYPSQLGERAPCALCEACLATARANDFRDWQRQVG